MIQILEAISKITIPISQTMRKIANNKNKKIKNLLIA
jgi:hypothetical protein